MLRVCLTLLITCVAAASPAYANHLLITEQEAKMSPAKDAIATAHRGITRGPRIEYVGDNEQQRSPVRLQLRFESFGGAKIDPDSLKVIYLRVPNVDLTDRVKSFVRATGLDIPDAELPPGDHLIKVDIKDSEGRIGSTTFILKILP
jgi:hypothetical protein